MSIIELAESLKVLREKLGNLSDLLRISLPSNESH